jgi:hypothetical protein
MTAKPWDSDASLRESFRDFPPAQPLAAESDPIRPEPTAEAPEPPDSGQVIDDLSAGLSHYVLKRILDEIELYLDLDRTIFPEILGESGACRRRESLAAPRVPAGGRTSLSGAF